MPARTGNVATNRFSYLTDVQFLIGGAIAEPIGQTVRALSSGKMPLWFSQLEFRSIIHSTRGKVEYENKCTDVLAPVSFMGGEKFIILMGGSSKNLS